MGKEKASTTTVVNQSTERQPTAEEKRLNQLEIERVEASQPGQIAIQKAGTDLGTLLLQGQELPGSFKDLFIDEATTQDIVKNSLADIAPSFQSAGLIDSGVAAEISARTAGDIRRASKEFNIGTQLNLLNQALGGQAQIQQPLLSQSQALGARLTTLGKTTTSGTTQQTTLGMNPFLKSFQTSLGKTLGSPSFGAGPFEFGG